MSQTILWNLEALVWILLNVNLSLNQTLLTFLLYVRQTWWLNWFWQFLCERLSSFHSKGFCYSYAWSCSLYEGRTAFCMGLISQKLCRFLLMFSIGFTSLIVLLLIPVSITFFVLSMVCDSISSNIVEVLWINPSANVFVFGDNVHHKDWLTYCGGTDRPGKPVIIFLPQMVLLIWLTFLLGSLTVTLTVLFFWIYLILLTQ